MISWIMKTSTPGALQLRHEILHLRGPESSRPDHRSGVAFTNVGVQPVPGRWSASDVIIMVIVSFSALNKRRVSHSLKSSRRLASPSFQRTGYSIDRGCFSTTGTCLRTSKNCSPSNVHPLQCWHTVDRPTRRLAREYCPKAIANIRSLHVTQVRGRVQQLGGQSVCGD